MATMTTATAGEEMDFDPSTMKKKSASARKKSVAFDDPSTADVGQDTAAPAGNE